MEYVRDKYISKPIKSLSPGENNCKEKVPSKWQMFWHWLDCGVSLKGSTRPPKQQNCDES